MKLIYAPLDIELCFQESSVAELVSEDRDYFSQMIFEFYESLEGKDEKWVLSEDNKLVPLKKHVALIDSPFLYDPGSYRFVQTALLKNISAIVAESPEYLGRGEELMSAIEQFGLEVVDELGYDFEVSAGEELRIDALLKMLKLKIFTTSDSLIERILSIMDVLKSLAATSLFIILNMGQFVGHESMEAFIKEAKYHDHKILLLGSTQSGSSVDARFIIDENQLVI